MPESYVIDPQRRVVFSRGTGVFTYAEFLEHMARMRADPQFRPDFDQLVDCRETTGFELTGDQVADLAARSIFSVRTRRAFVVASSLQYGLSHMLASHLELRGESGIRIFRDRAEALAWLNLPPDLDPFAAPAVPPPASP